MSKLDDTKYAAMVANAAAKIKVSSTVFKNFIADIKAVINGNDDIVTTHVAETASDDVHGLSGKIISESGSNTNGNYIRFADGTQICYSGQRGLTFSSARILQFTWTFPASFTSNPDISLTLIGNPTKGGALNLVGTLSTTSCGARYANPFADTFVSGDTATMMIVAIGRWE